MVIRTYPERSREESSYSTINRIAKVLTHEVRHLTNTDRSIEQSIQQSVGALMSRKIHERSPRENDADDFERKIRGRDIGVIHD